MKKPRSRYASDDAPNLDWTPLFSAFQDAFEWALDIATNLAREYPEEVAAVDRVRGFMRRRIAGLPAHIRADDVLFAFGLVIGAIERDLGPLPLVHSTDELAEGSLPRIPAHVAWAMGIAGRPRS